MTAEPAEPATILVVDDDAAVCWALEQALTQAGYQVQTAADATMARKRLRREVPDLVITDVRMPGESGLDLLAWLRVEFPGLPVVVSTAHGTVETAIEAVARGAFDYLPKPCDLHRTIDIVRRALGEDVLAASANPTTAESTTAIIGSTPAMQEVYRRIAAAANTDLGVLIVGPTGSGKELVAHALHRHGSRRGGPFVPVNCGALPEHLVESELFGHEAGAFTDAKTRTIGRIEAAHGGTLFLDEVAELPPPAQVKLLRFLEDQRFNRVGGSDPVQVDVRVIAATNRDLSRLTPSGAFREDLAYRLRVVTISLPALCDRLDDLPALVRHFLARAARRLDRTLAITDDALALLARHLWPGNVRELKHVIEEAAVLATGGIISPEDLNLPTDLTAGAASVTGERNANDGFHSAGRILANRLLTQHEGQAHQLFLTTAEEIILREAIARTQGNQLRAADILGINRITLKKRMDELGIGKSIPE